MRGAGIAQIQLLVVGRKAQPVRLVRFVGNHLHLAGLRIDAINRFLYFEPRLVTLVDARDPVPRIAEPDSSVRMNHNVVGSVERLALPIIGQHRDSARVLESDDAARVVFASELPAFIIERVAVRIVRRRAESADVPVFLHPAQLAIVRDIAEDQVSSAAVPGRTLRPTQPRVEPFDGRVVRFELGKARIQDHNVGIRITNRVLAAPVTLGCRRHGERRTRNRQNKRAASQSAFIRVHPRPRKRFSHNGKPV